MRWCFKIKTGLEMIKPSNNLANAYIKKSRDSMEMVEMSINAGKIEWAITTMYYCQYFILYALLQKIGIKSENHTCSILFAEKFLRDQIGKEKIEQLKELKDERIERQYYVAKSGIEDVKIEDINDKTKKFFFHVLEIINNITEEEIEIIRENLIKYKKSIFEKNIKNQRTLDK